MSCGGRRGPKKVLRGPDGQPILDAKGRVQYVVKKDAKGKPILDAKGRPKYEYDEHPAGNGTTGFGGQVSAMAAVIGVPVSDARDFVHGEQSRLRNDPQASSLPDPTREQVVAHFRKHASLLTELRDGVHDDALRAEGVDPDALRKRMNGYIDALTREANWHENDPNSKLPNGVEFHVLKQMPFMMQEFADQNRCEQCGEFASPSKPHMCAPKAPEQQASTPAPDLRAMDTTRTAAPVAAAAAATSAAYDPDALDPAAVPAPDLAVPDLRSMMAEDPYSAGRTAAQEAAAADHDFERATERMDTLMQEMDAKYGLTDTAPTQVIIPPHGTTPVFSDQEPTQVMPTVQPPSPGDTVVQPAGVGDPTAAPAGTAGPMTRRERLKASVLALFGITRCAVCGRFSEPTAHACPGPAMQDDAAAAALAAATVNVNDLPSAADPEEGVGIDGPFPWMKDREFVSPADLKDPSIKGELKGASVAGLRLMSRFVLNPKGWALMAPYALRAGLIAAPIILFGAGPLAPFAWAAAAFFMYRSRRWMKNRPPEERRELVAHYEKPYSWQRRSMQEFYDPDDPGPVEQQDQPKRRFRDRIYPSRVAEDSTAPERQAVG